MRVGGARSEKVNPEDGALPGQAEGVVSFENL